MTDETPVEGGWPEIDVRSWAPTKRSLHMYAQFLGKLRFALSPAQPNWLFTALQLRPRGPTTGPIPWRGGAIEASLDVFSSEIVVERSDGESRRIPLVPARTVADVYAAFLEALGALGIACTIGAIPQEVPDTTPFPDDRRPAGYDPAAVRRWFAAATAVAGVFDGWRAPFFGRSAIALWWGAFDVALMLYNGKRIAAPRDGGYLRKYDLNAEAMNAGLYFGDERTAPFFYGYLIPQPPGAAALPVAPAAWSADLGEWTLPYATVRGAADPAAELRRFLDALYEQCFAAAGWDRDAVSYAIPKRAARGEDG